MLVLTQFTNSRHWLIFLNFKVWCFYHHHHTLCRLTGSHCCCSPGLLPLYIFIVFQRVCCMLFLIFFLFGFLSTKSVIFLLVFFFWFSGDSECFVATLPIFPWRFIDTQLVRWWFVQLVAVLQVCSYLSLAGARCVHFVSVLYFIQVLQFFVYDILLAEHSLYKFIHCFMQW